MQNECNRCFELFYERQLTIFVIKKFQKLTIKFVNKEEKRKRLRKILQRIRKNIIINNAKLRKNRKRFCEGV